MSIVTFEDYKEFRCVASACRHTCCKGWEIDIDKDTYYTYRQLNGTFAERLQKNIEGNETPHFKLDAEERCPFLNKQNLCDIILHLGESSLCQICRDHPRFRNFLGTRTEIGLGLCCEEAVRLLLEKKAKMKLFVTDEANENLSPFQKELLQQREVAFSIAQNREKSIAERLNHLLLQFKATVPALSNKTLVSLLKSLERMDNAWNFELESLENTEEINLSALSKEYEIPFEQLLVYFLYRHFVKAYDAEEIKTYVAFCVFSMHVILSIFLAKEKQNKGSMQELQNIVRQFSSEIEYSEENMDTLLNFLWDVQN